MELHIFVLPFAKQLAGLLCGIAGQGAVQPADNLLREGVNRSLAVALLLWLVKSAKRCSGSTRTDRPLYEVIDFYARGTSQRGYRRKNKTQQTRTRGTKEKSGPL